MLCTHFEHVPSKRHRFQNILVSYRKFAVVLGKMEAKGVPERESVKVSYTRSELVCKYKIEG